MKFVLLLSFLSVVFIANAADAGVCETSMLNCPLKNNNLSTRFLQADATSSSAACFQVVQATSTSCGNKNPVFATWSENNRIISQQLIAVQNSAGGTAPCSLGGTVVQNGATIVAYAVNTVYKSCGDTCAMNSQVRTCSNGSLSGSFHFSSCRVITNVACP